MNDAPHDKRMFQMPLFISYPRSGCAWLNCVMELYFDRPRLREIRPTFLPLQRNDWMWFHDHDLRLDIIHNNVLYLYRNPVDVLYSYSIANYNAINMDFVHEQIKLLKKHYHKYLMNGSAKTIVRYENFREDFHKEFEKVAAFFNKKFDKTKLIEVLKIATKEQIVRVAPSKRYFSEKLCTNNYHEGRKKFREENSKFIKKMIIDDNLRQFFE